MKVAIVIAVETYSDARIPAVKFAEADAQRCAVALEQHGFAPDDQVVLINEKATKSAVESRVRRTMKGLEAEDELILFYTGRAFSEHDHNHLTCSDTDASDLVETSIRLAWLFKQFSESDCRKIVFFLNPGDLIEPAHDAFRKLATDWHDVEITSFFESSESCIGFVACQHGEASHTALALRHSIWSHHLLEAFEGHAPTALVNGVELTCLSLQQYLQQAVPRTLTQTFATKKLQSPWMVGASSSRFRLADLTELFAERQAAENPYAGQVKHITLLAERTRGVRSLSGFKKGHKEPDQVNNAAETFITKISSEELTADIQTVFNQLKNAFKFKRADLHISNLGDGTATIITPFFNYSVTVALDAADPAQVVFRRTVDAIKEPEQILSAEFAMVFQEVFDTVEFETASAFDLPAFVDRMEAIDDDQISVDYDPQVTYCNLRIAGVTGTIMVTSRSLSIVHTKPIPPQKLLQSFFGMQTAFVDQHDIRLIPLDGKRS